MAQEVLTFDEVMAELAKHAPYKPEPGHFCRKDLETEFDLTESESRKLTERLIKQGAIEFVGHYQKWHYYKYVGSWDK